MVKLSKQILGHFAHDVDQHIQTATVGHTDDDFLHALFTGGLNQFIHGGDKALTAFKGKAFLSNIFGV